jgi:pimeloyl-ACP methyl ester carboxylesterase
VRPSEGPNVVIPRPRAVEVGNGVVGVYEYGDADGAPVFVFHGTPSCGAGFVWTDDPARERAIRVIAPDRPGVGLSSRRDAYTVADYPAMVGALADKLKLDRFAVWGYSGGGPYAVACAALLPDRVTRAAVTAGMGEVGVWAEPADFEQTDRQLLALTTKAPAVARAILNVAAFVARRAPTTALKSFEKQLIPADLEVAATLGPPDETIALFTRAFLRGAHGVVADYRALAHDWGVTFDGIVAPFNVFHGDADSMVPLRHGEELVARIPSAQLTVWRGEGHLGTITHAGEVLDALR